LDEIANQCRAIFEANECENLDEIFLMGGSSGGARPKVNYEIDKEGWIVKFPSYIDQKDIGVQEYEYSICAKKCGIHMSETRLITSKISSGYFATKRFDRRKEKRIHMASVSSLLEASHRIPNLDYHILMRLTLQLTNDYQQTIQLFRRMCFNVFAHNKDDHSKNFSFLYDKEAKNWVLAPAYDLTYSNSIGGEHATTIDGNGSNPGMRELLAVAEDIKLDQNKAENIALEIEEEVQCSLRRWLK
jgi:serine/threonine-protein kinase HipA